MIPRTLAVIALIAWPSAGRAVAPAAPVPAKAPAGAPASPAVPGAEVKTSTAAPLTPSAIYTAERLRDPFSPLSGSGGVGGLNSSGKPFSQDDFNIHNLSLRGIMKDSVADYALFSDNAFGITFILRRGKLYDGKNKPVRGVSGKLRVKDRWAELETTDHDVQIFRLGEEEKD